MHRRRLFILLLSITFSACAAKAPAARAHGVSPADAYEQLHRDLDALFGAPAVAHAQWGVTFASVRDGRTLYSLNAGRFMVPASNQKLLTAVTAAERLGWDFRFTTRLLATSSIGPDGTLDGDLIVVSDGDPSINPRHPERWRAFDDWAAALRAKGLRIVSGRLIGCDDAFEEPGWGIGWAWDNLHFGYGAPATALQYNENQVEVTVGPGLEPGARAIITTSPYGSGLVIDHDVTTVASGGETTVSIGRVPGSPYLLVRGQVPVDARPVTLTAAVDNPTRFYLTALREALARHGIYVAGGLVDADDLQPPLSLDDATVLVEDRSPPVAELLDVMLKWSRNIYAETLLLAAAGSEPPASGTKALDAMRETLLRFGLGEDAYLPRDGSGLSRYDYVTADALKHLLMRLRDDPAYAERFESTLPVAGISGTLASRMKGTPAEGRVRAKTGTLSNVRALSGYLTTLQGETIVFSMLANNFRVPTAEIDEIMDAALNRVVLFAR